MEKPIPYDGNKPFIFISYSHKDNYAVWNIISKMNNDGYRIWYDNGINPGTSWDEIIANKILECKYFIAVISKNYIESDACKDELNYARDKVENLLLIYLDDSSLPNGLEMRIGRIQAIKIYEYQTENQFYNALYRSKNIEQFTDKIFENTELIEDAPVIENKAYISGKNGEVFEENENIKSTPKHIDRKQKTIIPGFRSGNKMKSVFAIIFYVISLLLFILVSADIYTSIGTKYADFEVPRGIYLIIGYILLFFYNTNFGHIKNRIFKYERKPLWLKILIDVLVNIFIVALMFGLLVMTEVLLIMN